MLLKYWQLDYIFGYCKLKSRYYAGHGINTHLQCIGKFQNFVANKQICQKFKFFSNCSSEQKYQLKAIPVD